MKAVEYYNKYGPKIFSLKDKDDIDGYKRFWLLQNPDLGPYLERRRTVCM